MVGTRATDFPSAVQVRRARWSRWASRMVRTGSGTRFDGGMSKPKYIAWRGTLSNGFFLW